MHTDLHVTRRGFIKTTGGALVATAVFDAAFAAKAEAAGLLDATKLASWLEIHADGRIVARTGKTETGTSASAFYAQAVAEELDVDPSTVTVVMGHTDETPEGGFSAGFLGGVNNLKKVASLTRTALIGLAATRLGTPAANLTVANGVVSGGGKSVSYAELVKGQQLDLKIPVTGAFPAVDPNEPTGLSNLVGINVTGNPPLKPIGQYSVIGKEHDRPGIREIVTAKAQYGGDVSIPGMLHARMVRPSALGATLVSAGKLDAAKFPTAEVVVKHNLVAVVSPNEWEAVSGAQAVAASTKWTAWSGLPTSDKVIAHMKTLKWSAGGHRGDEAKTAAAMKGAARVLSATYEEPYTRHAPMGAYVAVADVKADGTTTVYAQSSQSQGARAHVAHILGVPTDKVTIRWYQGPGQYGRTTFGGDSAMADAAILSQLLRKPVRVQWTLAEDLAWSSTSPAWYSDVKAGLDAQGNLVALSYDWYSGHENDARMIGSILAGAPSLTIGIASKYGAISTVWPYQKALAFERAHFIENIANAANGGLRGNIMRTPMQRQQNDALEGIVTEAAAAAKADPIEYRIRHTTDQAFAGILKATAEAHGWSPRPSPNPAAKRTGSAPVKGRGVGVVLRSGAPWVAIVDVEVTPSTGVVKLTSMTVGVDVGKVMNPKHLISNMQGGAVMGVGEALFEEVTFDTSKVTSTDWNTYRIPKMADVPVIKAVFTSRNDRGINGGGEAANTAVPPAIMAAFFDATGVMPRRIPLTPAYVKSILA